MEAAPGRETPYAATTGQPAAQMAGQPTQQPTARAGSRLDRWVAAYAARTRGMASLIRKSLER